MCRRGFVSRLESREPTRTTTSGEPSHAAIKWAPQRGQKKRFLPGVDSKAASSASPWVQRKRARGMRDEVLNAAAWVFRQVRQWQFTTAPSSPSTA